MMNQAKPAMNAEVAQLREGMRESEAEVTRLMEGARASEAEVARFEAEVARLENLLRFHNLDPKQDIGPL